MRLLEIHPDGRFSLVDRVNDDTPYAILSHTWGSQDEEVSLQDLQNGTGMLKNGYCKLAFCCSQASQDSLKYVWIDTCCIDKTSSAELSEAINSMYMWYEDAQVCYAYLADVPSSKAFAQSRWFDRGWTLQELLAPADIVFLDQDWKMIGTKRGMSDVISLRTKIPAEVLMGERSLGKYSVAQRMSWAAGRKTTRVEDRAYCMMGLFEINMPLIYGEGDNAFIRLQEEIMKVSDNHSLFAWQSEDDRGGCLATSPDSFKTCPRIVQSNHLGTFYEPPSVSGRGVQLELRFMGLTLGRFGLAILNCCDEADLESPIAIYVRDQSLTLKRFDRINCNARMQIPFSKLDPLHCSVKRLCINKGRAMRRAKLNGYSDSIPSTVLDLSHSSTITQKVSSFEAMAHAINSASDDDLWLFLTRGDVEINIQYPGGRTALSYAAAEGSESSVRMLLSHQDIQVNLADENGRTPLSWAAENDKISSVKLLLANVKVDIDRTDASGRTPLSWAAANGHHAIVSLLLDTRQISVDISDVSYRRTPLIWAAMEGKETTVKLLLDTKKVNINMKDNEGGRTALVWAARNGHDAVVKLLLEDRRISIDRADDEYGQTPLSWAAEKGHGEIVARLLSTGKVDIDQKDTYYERTPLIWAAMEGKETTVKLLLDTKKVNINMKDNEGGRTALVWAARNGHDAVVKLLLRESGISIDRADDEYGQTPLSWAAEKGHGEIVARLLNTGKVDIDQKDTRYGRTPLIWAAMEGKETTVKLLLDTKKVELDARDTESGRTPLMWARENGHEAVERLLQ